MNFKMKNSQTSKDPQNLKQKRRTREFTRRKRRKRQPTKFKKEKTIKKVLALERIHFLMEKAKEIYSINPDLANRYADLSRRYSMSVKISFPMEYKKLICKKCKKLMIPGKTCRTRIQSRKKRGSRYVITCLSCNNMTHIYFKRKDKKKTKNDTEKVQNKTKGEL